ncbi:MAG: hypothetical protein HY301_05125 [Verrucomicrobia bacterium]|nr:hypothetical protein [Verrucomicrobiota bacterium]
MKTFITTLLTAGTVLAVAFIQPAVPAAEKEGKAKSVPYTGKVSAVDKVAKTVTLATKEKSRTYQVTAETKINKAGKPATLDDAVVGEEASAYGHEADGKYVAQSLRLGPKTDAPAKGKKKEAEKK